MTNILNQEFSDLYLGESSSWIKGLKAEMKAVGAFEVPIAIFKTQEETELINLYRICQNKERELNREEFSLAYMNVRYRVSKIGHISGSVYVLRKIKEKIINHKDLGIYIGYLKLLLQSQLTGLVLVSGTTGAGKTTTLTSILQERQNAYGGITVTIEDPIEYILEPTKGAVFQTEVTSTEGFSDNAKKMMRWNPNQIFLGEIRDGESALESLRAAVNGSLVFSSIHSDNPVNALYRFVSLISTDKEDMAKHLLSVGLTAILHQEWLDTDRTKLKVSMLYIRMKEKEAGIRSIIRNGDFTGLQNAIDLLTTQIQQHQSKLG